MPGTPPVLELGHRLAGAAALGGDLGVDHAGSRIARLVP
jgi:hypothetical protein